MRKDDKILIYVSQADNKYQIRFPYNPDIISIIKQVPTRTWEPSLKCWTIRNDRLGFLINAIKSSPYAADLRIQSNEALNVNMDIDPTVDIPNIDISNEPYYIHSGLTPYPHQEDCLRYTIANERKGFSSGFILCDEPGLGKTNEVLNIAMWYRAHKNIQHCLVICCINSSKYNWLNDIDYHTNGIEIPYILGSRRKRDGSLRTYTGSKEKLEDLTTLKQFGGSEDLPFFIVMNIEGLRAKEKKHFPIYEKLLSLIDSGYIGMIAVDEIHKNASPHSAQGQQLLKLKTKAQRNVVWIPMTGTPIVSKPTDVYTPLGLVDGHTFTSFYMWCREFCVYGGFQDHDIVGYKNIPKLKSMLQSHMLRRLKGDVLKLPPVIECVRYIDNTPYQNKLYSQLLAETKRRRAEIRASSNPAVHLIKLRQINGSPELVDKSLTVGSDYLSKNAKLKECLEVVEQIVANGEKVVIFSNWVQPLRTLYKFVSRRWKTCCYTGTMTSSDREAHKARFINDPSYSVMIGTIGALGTSHTLTVARNVILYDEPTTPSDRKQAIERCHRIGTSDSVCVYTLLCRDTVDEKLHDLLYRRDAVSKFIVDDKLDFKNHPELLDELLK